MNHKRLSHSERRKNERRLKEMRNYPPAPVVNEEKGSRIAAMLSALREAQKAAALGTDNRAISEVGYVGD